MFVLRDVVKLTDIRVTTVAAHRKERGHRNERGSQEGDWGYRVSNQMPNESEHPRTEIKAGCTYIGNWKR